MVDVQAVQALYDQHRYMDAYALTREAWNDRGTLDRLDARGVVLAARLSSRLGGNKWSRALFREAARRFPGDPWVRAYVDGRVSHERHFLDVITLYDREPQLATDCAELRATWCASAAQYWVTCRDFARAHAAADAAIAHGGGAWALATRAWVLLLEDRWAEALTIAEEASAREPGSTFAAHVMGAALSRLGQPDEAYTRQVALAASTQTAEIVQGAAAHTLGRAERLERGSGERAALLAQAESLVDRYAELVPLADREEQLSIAQLRCDLADVAADRDKLLVFGRHSGTRYYRTVAENVAKNPAGARTILPHTPVRQRHQTCVPASFVTCMSHFGLTFDHDRVAAELTHGGTLTWRLRAFCESQGLAARGFIVDARSARALVAARLPFILMFRGEDFGHAVAVIGLDEAQGTLLVHDPSHERWGRVLLDKLGAAEAPLGPMGLVVVPTARAAELDALALPGVVEEAARSAYIEPRAGAGQAERSAVVDDLTARSPDHPITTQLRAWSASERGATEQALELHQALVRAHPECREARAGLLSAIEEVGSLTLLRDTLRAVVDEGRIPGHAAGEDWIRPHPRHLARYADVLRGSSEFHARAERVLRRSIRAAPNHGLSLHVLGDLWWAHGRLDDAELAFRLAATATTEDEHMARAYADVCHHRGRAAEALAWLRARARALDGARIAFAPWVTLAQALRDYGFPDESHQVLDEALAARPEDGELLSIVARMRIESGRFEEARALRGRLERHTTKLGQIATWLTLAATIGERQEQVEWCVRWIAEEPGPRAHGAWLQAIAEDRGADAALTEARALAAAHPEHEEYDSLLLARLAAAGHETERVERLRARVARSPHDGWAWRELSLIELDDVERKPADQRAAAVDRLTPTLEAARRTSAGSPTLHAIEARRAHVLGDHAAERAALERAVVREPTFVMPLEALIDRAGREADERDGVLAIVDGAIERTAGPKVQASRVALALARALGLEVAQARVSAWRARWPDDVELTIAHGELAMMDERGKSVAEALIDELLPMVARFPDSLELRFVLACAYERAERVEPLVAFLQETLRRAPLDAGARRMMARAHFQQGRTEDALAVMREATALSPLDPAAWLSLAERLMVLERYNEAERVLADGIERLPEIMDLRELRLSLHAQRDRGDLAVAESRALTERFADGAYVHLIHARTLLAHGEHSTRAEIEAALEKSVALNAQLDEGVDEYAVHLANLGEPDAALALIDRLLPSVASPEVLRGRRAWLLWTTGKQDQALAEMMDVVERHPSYLWGWACLHDWLDEKPGTTRLPALLAALDRVPVLGPELGLVRAQLLERLEKPPQQIEAAWERLVAEYPRHPRVAGARFDALWAAGRTSAARKTIDAYLARAPRDAAARARLVRALVKEGETADAVREAVAVWTAPGDGGPPDEHCWAVLEQATLVDRAIDPLLRALNGGADPHRAPIHHLVQHLGAQPPGSASALTRLTGWAQSSPKHDWALAAILESHLDHGRVDEVARWLAAHRADCEQSRPLWAVIGAYYARAGSPAETIAWLETWPRRGQVGFWVVWAYVEALEDARRFDAIGPAATAALDSLLFDDARTHVLDALLRNALRSGDDPTFRAQWARRAALPDLPHREIYACFAEILADPPPAAAALGPLRARLSAAIAASERPADVAWAREALRVRLQARRTGWAKAWGWLTRT